jgi:hypothetical protein
MCLTPIAGLSAAGFQRLGAVSEGEFAPAFAFDDVAFLKIRRPLLEKASGQRVDLKARVLACRMIVFRCFGETAVVALRTGQFFREAIAGGH